MKVTVDKYTDKNDFIFAIIPTIAFSKNNGIWSIGFLWMCFSINIEF